ncbi:hypothetical protein FHT44_005042 [Mycolicibacterium sp. BK634]|uniref:hypothetical protein n=1 Tax=Mycolicibacterium sp. BK634 TaxID=2587099 RepID=UPI0016138773|nr:hypothetical protein [Mycolicibacterium sp. BK634]MBB3752530.1 hypothetical protein [Mycolicibacterium sp. BK634]
MTVQGELSQLAIECGWQAWDHSEKGEIRHTYGIQDTACLHVRFEGGDVDNAIYVHFPSARPHTGGDQFIWSDQEGKRDLVEHILRTVPEHIPARFPDVGQACGGHRCTGAGELCFECDYEVYNAEIEKMRERMRELEAENAAQ